MYLRTRIILTLSLACPACNGDGEAGDGQSGPATQATTGTTSHAPDPPTTGTPDADATSTGAVSTDDGQTSLQIGSSSTSEAGTGDPTTTADPPLPTCGDGIVDPGEQCDQGSFLNSDSGACTVQCELAKCGDSLVWVGEEDCDNGPDNNDDLYGGCTTQCKFGARCNDGTIQAPEECDLGDDNGTDMHAPDGVPCSNGCRYHARLAFLTSAAYKGGELGGVEGAHLKCQILAKQAKFDNAAGFMAWLSDAQHSPFLDFDHGPGTANLAYVLPNGVRLADDWDDLVSYGPNNGIAVTETGEVLLNKYVWTGTAPSGKVFDPAATCTSWSSSSAVDNSRVGLSGVPELPADAWKQWDAERQWTNFASAGCHLPGRLYCIEQ